MKAALLGCAIAIGAIGCGGASHPARAVVTCTVTLSGTTTGTFACGSAAAAWTASDNMGVVGFASGAGSQSGPTFTGDVGAAGQLHTGTYADADANAQGALSVTEGTGVWIATVGGGTAHVGSYSMALTEVDPLAQNLTSIGYTVHGTLDASLQPVSGSTATGTVDVHVAV